MKPSAFLRLCAKSVHEGRLVESSRLAQGWWNYVNLTLPDNEPYRYDDDGNGVRVLRLCLAAAIAEAEGE